MASIWEYAYNHHTLNEVLDTLTLKQFHRETKIESVPEQDETSLSNTELKKAALIASLLASSPVDKHKQKAIDFAILAYLEKQNRQYASYCYVILSRTDNIQQGMHLPEVINSSKEQFLVQFDDVLDLEISVARALAALTIDNHSIYLSKFQKQLWTELKQDDRILAISGPTSSGKSFIVQNHFIQLCKSNSVFKGIYVVPTRALIYEVSSALRKQLKHDNIAVKIAFGESLDKSKRELFVVTPERCLRFLKENPDNVKIDLIFFDEIQKLEDSERGVVFEHIIHELLRSHQEAKIVLAGPYLKNLKNTVMKLSGISAPTVESEITPVYQSKTIFRAVKGKKKQVDIFLKSASGNTLITSASTKKSLYSHLKTNHKEAMAEFVAKYGKNSSNIMYAPRRTTAEGYATALAEIKSETNETEYNERVNDLINYLGEEIHPKYSLIRCLRQGVAFHHGSIPELAKMEVEELYREGFIKDLACTSTLLEGVNLPADKIFIFRPYINDSRTPLSDFEFGNLIGRAGRVSSKLNGAVCCIELDTEKWADQKLSSDFKKEISTATGKAFNQYKDQLIANLALPSTQIDAEQAVIYTIILLRHKALKSTSELVTYLKTKSVTSEEAELIAQEIQKSIQDLIIPKEIVRLNQTLDPLLQNELYLKIIEDGEKNWFISRNPLDRRSGENSPDCTFSEKNFYYQFEEITLKLDEIFEIERLINSSARSHTKRWYSIRKIVYDAALWLQQSTLRYMIKKELGDDAREEDLRKIDRTILEVVSHINNHVKFDLVKYFSLLSDILRSIFEEYLKPSDDPLREKLRKSLEYQLSIPEMIELGACDPTVLRIIRSGINRSVAIEAARFIPEKIEGNPVSWLVQNRLNKLLPIFQRHIINQGF